MYQEVIQIQDLKFKLLYGEEQISKEIDRMSREIDVRFGAIR